MKIEEDFTLWGARDYVKLSIPEDWNVLEIGPGHLPLERANVYVDKECEILDALPGWSRTIVADLMDGLPMIEDKEFDFVWCAHVLEHVRDPQFAAETISRIGKRGTIVMPSVFKDALFNFEERDHDWHVLPSSTNGRPIFIRINPDYVATLRDDLVQQAMCFLYRTGTQHECTAERYLRAWYQIHEPHLDVIYHWEDQLDVVVIR